MYIKWAMCETFLIDHIKNEIIIHAMPETVGDVSQYSAICNLI